MDDSASKLHHLGRRKTPVLERIDEFLEQPIRGPISDDLKDQHWIWQGKVAAPKTRIRYNPHSRAMNENTAFIMPCRIRDNDGKLKSVVRILFRELRGQEYPYAPRRTHGCDFRCVNPFHLALPEGLNELEVAPQTDGDDIDGLTEEIGNFIAVNGSDKTAILNRFLVDYTEDEISQALARL